jgi:acetyl esterase/lipase
MRDPRVYGYGSDPAQGWAVWNVDYRGVGAGGGWPATLQDVAAAVDLLADVGPDAGVSLDRVAVVGHSAGGHLALWTAARHRLPGGVPGARPRIRPSAVVAQAAVTDLAAAARGRIGDDAVRGLLGAGPDDDPELYALTSPVELLPLGVPLLLVTGDADDRVPPEQSASAARAARAAGDEVTLAVVPGEGHSEHLDPSSGVWSVAAAWLDDRMRA